MQFAYAEWNRLRKYHRLQKIIIETITMQQVIKSTTTRRNLIHISPCMMMKPKTLAISIEMVSSSMNLFTFKRTLISFVLIKHV